MDVLRRPAEVCFRQMMVGGSLSVAKHVEVVAGIEKEYGVLPRIAYHTLFGGPYNEFKGVAVVHVGSGADMHVIFFFACIFYGASLCKGTTPRIVFNGIVADAQTGELLLHEADVVVPCLV